jgi:glyoxylase-like metal-dependent hydrolase (beta-lactamase superfamily II)
MPAEPRIVPVPCPFGSAGGTVWVYYIDAPQPALVDTGVAASPEAVIEPALNAAGLSLKNVKWILATHGHWDHIGGAHTVRSMAADDVQVAIHSADAGLLKSKRAHMEQDGYQALRFRYLDDPAALARQDAMLMENLSGELIADRELQGGERISLGGDVTVEVVPTAGHSHGSVSFLIDGVDWMCTGDGVQVLGGGPAGFPLYVDPAAYSASMHRLLDDVRPKRLYAGHHFRLADGTILDATIDGPAVQSALRDGLALHERLVELVRTLDGADLAQPTAQTLWPVAEALGLAGDKPETWPPSLFTTLHGYRKLAAAVSA